MLWKLPFYTGFCTSRMKSIPDDENGFNNTGNITRPLRRPGNIVMAIGSPYHFALMVLPCFMLYGLC